MFDGYEPGPTPKDMTQQRRIGLSAGVEVNVKEDMILTVWKEMFLANKSNKQRFIYMLGSKLEKEGCEVVYSEGDADFDIVNKAKSVSTDMAAVVVGENTDLLILLLHHAKQDRKSIYLSPQQKQSAMIKARVWDIKFCQRVLGSETCQSIFGSETCDTTSSLFGIGKGLSLKMLKKKKKFQECANFFNDESSTKDQVRAAGEKALIALYNGEENVSLDELRYNGFVQNLSRQRSRGRSRGGSLPTSLLAQGALSTNISLFNYSLLRCIQGTS